MITSKKKRYGGHWIMRDGEKIGEAWKYPRTSGFGMSIGGNFTDLAPVYWRGEKPAQWGQMTVSAERLIDLVAIAEEHFGKAKS